MDSTPTQSEALAGTKRIAVVIGARGGTGSQLCHQALEAFDEVRAVVRNPSKIAPGTLPEDPRLTVMSGDVSDDASLAAAFTGATVVFNAAAGRSYEACCATDRDGVGISAAAALKAGAQRYVLISSQLVHPSNAKVMIRLILNNVVTKKFWKKQPGLMDLKWEGEQLLRKAGIPYTIIRPGRLVHGTVRKATPHVGQTNAHFMKGAPSTRADVAAVAVLASSAAACANTTFEMSCDPPGKQPAAPPQAETLFAVLDAAFDKQWV